MKKISILISLILCVTISGVYAAWMYTGNTVSSAERTLSHGMATATSKGDMGTFKIGENDNSIDIKIDQSAVGDYTAKLIITGSIIVTFDPNDGAPSTVTENAVPAQCIISVENIDENKYDNTPIYKIADTPIDLVWEKQTDGTFKATVTSEQIDEVIDLGKAFVLETHEKWTTFHDLEKKITIRATFSQK